MTDGDTHRYDSGVNHTDPALCVLSARRLTERLDVQAPALYWHFRDKRALLDAMADALVAGTDLGPPHPGEGWQD